MSTFRPMLASEYDPKYPLNFPVLVSPKLDGIRCVIRNGQALTRSLKPIPNRYIRAALHGLPDFDGELVVGDVVDPKVWNNSSSAVMSHDGEPEFQLFVFDHASDLSKPYAERLDFVLRRAPMYGLTPVIHDKVNNLVELATFEAKYVKAGFEGLMIRDPNGPYKFGRSTAKEGYLLKMKRFDDLEARIVGVRERMRNTAPSKVNERGLLEKDHKSANMSGAGDLGAFVCQIDASSGIEFDVGSGLTDELRKEFWRWALTETAQDPVGKVIKIKHQGWTPDGLPRFPIFLGFRDERDMS